jgi:uncharacterized lipoprotein YddW (UPF0748 family)
MTDASHLSALRVRLSNEREYLRRAKTDAERKLRGVWIAQIEREIAHEERFIAERAELPEISDDELLAALTS